MLKTSTLKLIFSIATMAVICINPIQARGSSMHDGTSSGGGGNGFNNAALESYIVEIENLPAYIKHLKPMFDRMTQQSQDRLSKLNLNSESDSNKMFRKLGIVQSLLTKTWYIAPVKLKPLSNESIGISFSANQSQQIAIQGKNAIWVDQNIFNQMSEEEQALLILHEIMMEIYFVKTKTYFDLCKGAAIKNNYNIDCQDAAYADSFLGNPETINELSSADYENIRNTTYTVFKNRQTISESDLMGYLYNHNYHRFIFNPKNLNTRGDQKTEVSEVVYLTHEDRKNSLKKLQSLNKEMDTCLAYDMNVEFPCSIEYTENVDATSYKYTTTNSNGSHNEGLLDITRDEILISDKNFFNFSFRFSEKLSPELSLTRNSGAFEELGVTYTGFMMSEDCLMLDKHADCLGKEFSYLVFFYNERTVLTGGKNKKVYDLMAIARFKQIYTEFKIDDNGVTRCLSEKPETTNVNNDMVIAYRKKDFALIENLKRLLPLYGHASLCPNSR